MDFDTTIIIFVVSIEQPDFRVRATSGSAVDNDLNVHFRFFFEVERGPCELSENIVIALFGDIQKNERNFHSGCDSLEVCLNQPTHATYMLARLPKQENIMAKRTKTKQQQKHRNDRFQDGIPK